MDKLFYDQKKRSEELRYELLSERKNRLHKLGTWILNHREDIQEALKKDLNRSANDTDIVETYVTLSETRMALKNLEKWTQPIYKSSGLTYIGSKAYVYHEPKGVCLIISPWNYPFQLSIVPLISAIAAGNTVILKPSELSFHTSELIKDMTTELFKPSEVVTILGGVPESTELLTYPFDHIYFTGSSRVGKIVMKAASNNLTSITLELGGKSPTIVDETANIDDTVEKIAWGKWLNSGQTCVAPDYVYVHESIYDIFLNSLINKINTMYGDLKDYSHIINEEHRSRILDLIEDAKQQGGQIIIWENPTNADDAGNSVNNVTSDNADIANIDNAQEGIKNNLLVVPTIITSVESKMKIMQDEIFGPILPVIKYKDLEHIKNEINKRPKPLSLYLFTNNTQTIDYFKKHTSSGSMTINDCVCQFTHPYLPIGGINNSGIGRSAGHGYYGFKEFSHEKSILEQRIGMTVPKMVYPPITNFKKMVINMMVKYL